MSQCGRHLLQSRASLIATLHGVSCWQILNYNYSYNFFELEEHSIHFTTLPRFPSTSRTLPHTSFSSRPFNCFLLQPLFQYLPLSSSSYLILTFQAVLQFEIFITSIERYSDNVHQEPSYRKEDSNDSWGSASSPPTIRGSQKTRVTVAFGGQLFSVQSSITVPVSPYMTV